MAIEVRVEQSKKIIVALSEEEAGKVAKMCIKADWHKERWAEELYDAITIDAQVESLDYVTDPNFS